MQLTVLFFISSAQAVDVNASLTIPGTAPAQVQIQGKECKSGVECFLGIPYAAAPVGPLRWDVPHPHDWSQSTTFDATEFPKPCAQTENTYTIGRDDSTEDCLKLNIWRQQKSSGKPAAVYVFIHGGSDAHGGTALSSKGIKDGYDGSRLVETGEGDVMVVTIQYRLGIFGFLGSKSLTTGKSELFPNGTGSTGNFGSFDMAAAVMWVHDNIHNFGGDNKRITVGGQSSGSAGVASLLGSNQLPDKMVSGAVMESGGFSQWASLPMDAAELIFQNALKFSGCQGTDPVQCLRSKDTQALIKVAALIESAGGVCLTGDTWGAVLDGVFIEQHLGEVPQRNLKKDVAVIFGSQSEDGADFFPYDLTDYCKGCDTNVDPKHWATLRKVNTCDLELDEFDSLYNTKFNNKFHNDRYMEATQFTTDQHYLCPAVRYQSNAKVFRYKMGVPLPMNIDYDVTLGGSQDKDQLVRHSANLPFYWSYIPEDSPQYKISLGMRYYYANFIRFGDVNGDQTTNKSFPQWNPDSQDTQNTMDISLQNSFKPMALSKDVQNRCKYWSTIFEPVNADFFTSCLPMDPPRNHVAKCPATTLLI